MTLFRIMNLGPFLSNAQFTCLVNRIRVVASHIGYYQVFSRWENSFTQSLKNSWEDSFSDLVQEVLHHLVSNHFPILLESNRLRWVLYLFIWNMWLTYTNFVETSRMTWCFESAFEGWEGFTFVKKFQFLKGKLKVWEKKVFGDTRTRKMIFLKRFFILDMMTLDMIRMIINLLNCPLLNDFEDIFVKEDISWRQK